MNSKTSVYILVGVCCICMLFSFNRTYSQSIKQDNNNDHPKIVNIVNFIRLLEPRDSAVTQTVLYETVVKQVQMMKKYKLGGTFLLQYDALLDPRYQKLLKGLSRDSFEIGAWWELEKSLPSEGK